MADLGMAVVLTGESAVKAGLAGLREETRKLMDATVGVSGSFKSAAESASAFTAGIRSLAEAENSLHVAAQNQIADLRAQKIALQDVGYRQAQKEIKALQEELNPAKVQTFSQTWQELASKYYLVSQAAHVAGGVIMSLVDAASKYELIRARFNAAEGSKLLGARDLKEAQELAKAPGVGLEQVANTMATLRGMKVTASETKELIKGIGQANASAAGTAETFGRVMYQIQQSVSYGKLTMEDLKPIVQAIPTLGAAMQAHFGASQAEQLNDLLKKSGKSVREFWLEMAELGEKMPATGETIANNMDNMSDAWVRFRAALASTDTIKGATRAMGGLLEKIAEFLEKDQSLERSYIVRTRVVTQVQQGEQKKYGGAAPSLPAGMNFGAVKTDSIMAGILEQGRVADSVKAATKGVTVETSLWAQAVGKTKLEIDALGATKEAAEKKDRDARAVNKAAADATKSERDRIAAHRLASNANVETNFDRSVTLRSGLEWEAGDDPEHRRNRERADATDEKKYETSKREAEQAMREKIRLQKEYTKLIQDENQKRIEFERQYWQQVQTSATSTINSIAQTLIMSGGSMKDKLRQILAQGESALISGGVNMLMGAAFAPATGGASMAMPGALGLLGSFMGMRATGGATLGPVGVGERGPEVFRPATPGTVYNSSSSHYNYSGPITVVVSGANANEVAKDLPRAIENAQRNRRQTSISR